ncbi:recombination protein RecR [Patescibacteria group bacterium]|nr:recombination protein RecR [Patescibacteria group bacterium]MCH8889056.1 recombination protein RecR [Patescibacteria group bacterium]
MDTINKLTEYFTRFPGIGPRQAKRFVYFLLRQPSPYHKNLATIIAKLGKEINVCNRCMRYFTPVGVSNSCVICGDKKRVQTSLMVLGNDVDLDNVERGKIYDGLYFVLGGIVPILEKNPETKIRINELITRIKSDGLKEIILAMSATTDGENTEKYVCDKINELAKTKKITISHLGRGLSTGSELEYSDSETIKNALNSRK